MKPKVEIDADEVRETLERLREQGAFPEKPVIKRFEVVPDYDSTGDPAYYISVLLDDATPDEDLVRDKVKPIERLVFDSVVRGPDEPWPYVRIVREREHLAPVEEW
ncbi:MAG TPA: hypothetical protein VF170_16905 [Planctomycetaceae bacterium]